MSEIAPGSVTVADLYRELVGMRQDITRALTRIEVIDSRNMTADQIHSDHETRIRAMERFRFSLIGASVTVSAIVSALGTWISLVLIHH